MALKVAMSWLKDYLDAIKHGRLHPFSEVERKTRAATRDEPWGPTGVQLNELALISHEEVDAHIIFAVLERRLLSHGERWRSVYKALQVVEFLIKRGHERCPVLATPLLGLLHSLATGFAYTSSDGKDHGVNVRVRAAAVAAVLEDLPSLWALREQLAERMRQHYHEWVAAPLNPTHPSDDQAPAVVPSHKLVYEGMTQVLSASNRAAPASTAPPNPINTSGVPVNLKAAITPETARQLNARLSQLMARSDNKHCADCQAYDPASRANWASVTCGVFLCLKCAGIHRGLGVHISQVRSVNLDTWLPHQVALMEATGNGPANQYYEALLPAGQRPARDSPAMAAFIREKYANKRWANSLGTWPPVVDSQEAGSPGSGMSPGSRTLTASPLSTGGGTPASSVATTTTSPSASSAAAKHVGVFGRLATHAARAGTATSAALSAPGRRAAAAQQAARSPPAQVAGTAAAPTHAGAIAWHSTPTLPAGQQAIQRPEPAREPPAPVHDDALLIELSDDEDGHDAQAGSTGQGAQLSPMQVDPAMGVLEWLDAQHQAGHGLPYSTCIPAGPLSPAGPSTCFMPTSPLPTGGGHHAGHVTHVVLSSGGPPAWVPSYIPPHPSNPTTPLSTPLNLSGTFPGGMLASHAAPGAYVRQPGYGAAGRTGGTGALPAQGMPPHLVALAAQHVMVNGSGGPHLVYRPTGASGIMHAYPVAGAPAADEQVACALDELAVATVTTPSAASSPAKTLPASGPTRPAPASDHGTPGVCMERSESQAGFGSTQLPCVEPPNLLDALPPDLPPPTCTVPFRGNDPFRASVLPFQPMQPYSPVYLHSPAYTRHAPSSQAAAGLLAAPQSSLSPGRVPLNSPRHAQPQKAQPSLDDMMKGLVVELDATLSGPAASSLQPGSAAGLQPPAQLLASCSLPLPANPAVQQQARTRLAAAGVVKPVSLPNQPVGQPMGRGLMAVREGALAQAMIKGRWHTDEQSLE